MLVPYRRLGADPPFGDPRTYHGVAMEGCFWRVTDPAAGLVVVVFSAVNRDRAGQRWATVGLAAHPSGLVRAEALPDARTSGRGLGVHLHDGARTVLRADARSLHVDLGPDARLDVALDAAALWPAHRAFGGIGPAGALPGLSQYWHPWLLHARATGAATIGGERLRLGAGASVYAEKSWGAGGFPDRWWWGQAHGFGADERACVAFAGGPARIGSLPALVATSVVVHAAGETVRLTRPPALLRVRADAGGWVLRGRTARHAVEVEGHAGPAAPLMLPVPVPAERRNADGVAAQHLAGELRVRLRRGRRLVFEGTSRLAGLERGGGP